jgi:hypothetical protein
MNWIKKQMLLNPASPKLRKIFLAVMAISAVLMIAFGQYSVALGFACFLLADYFQHKTKK